MPPKKISKKVEKLPLPPIIPKDPRPFLKSQFTTAPPNEERTKQNGWLVW